jgi:predicted RNA binding protein YcfA (HicA-like mRNA interferase family)
MKISEIIVLLQQDGWTLKRVPGSAGISPTRRNLAW